MNTSTTSQNRVKYNKGKNSSRIPAKTSHLTHTMCLSSSGSGGNAFVSQKSSVTGSGGHAGGPNTASQLRQGLNPMLRGYSPSKHRWKIAGTTATSTQNGATSSAGHAAAHRQNSAQYGHFGGTNPNVYTRSTKHTPAHASKV